jgi:hypothetical protein
MDLNATTNYTPSPQPTGNGQPVPQTPGLQVAIATLLTAAPAEHAPSLIAPTSNPQPAEFREITTATRDNIQGVLKLPNGFVYVGEMRDGKPNGQGICKRPDGSILYKGEWLPNERGRLVV